MERPLTSHLSALTSLPVVSFRVCVECVQNGRELEELPKTRLNAAEWKWIRSCQLAQSKQVAAQKWSVCV